MSIVPPAVSAAAFRNSLRFIVSSFLNVSARSRSPSSHLALNFFARSRSAQSDDRLLSRHFRHDPYDPYASYQDSRVTICPLRGGPNTVPVLMRPNPAVGTPCALRCCVCSGLAASGLFN